MLYESGSARQDGLAGDGPWITDDPTPVVCLETDDAREQFPPNCDSRQAPVPRLAGRLHSDGALVALAIGQC